MDEVLKSRRVLVEYRNSLVATRTMDRIDEFGFVIDATDLERGHRIYHQIYEMLAKLDSLTYYRTHNQRVIQLAILSGLARYIYGQAIINNEIEIMEHNGFEALLRIIGLTMPRRGGKTEAVAQIIAVLLLCVPNIKIIAVAPSIRAAGGDSGLMGHVRRILVQILKHPANKIYGKKDETMILLGPEPNDRRCFHSYPGGAGDK